MYRRKSIVIVVICVFVFFMALGYAAFSTTLNINGTASTDSEWNVHFTNMTNGSTVGSASNNAGSPSFTETTAYMDAAFKYPGDAITYQLTLTNDGNLDAIVDNIEAKADGSDAIIYTMSGLKIGEKIAAGANKVITIKIEYDSNVTSQPVFTTKTLTVSINCVQDTGQTITPTDPIIDHRISVLFNPVTYEKCNAEDAANSCYKWYALSYDESNTDLILSTNLGDPVAWNDTAGATKANGPVTLLNYMQSQTNNWSSLLSRQDSYTETSTTYPYTINYKGFKARLATATELNALKDSSGNLPEWLSTNGARGFWLASSKHDYSITSETAVDVIFNGPTLVYFNIDYNNVNYLRPVITVPSVKL